MDSLRTSHNKGKVCTIPNGLTLGRMGISTYVGYILATDGPSINLGGIYALGALTDFLDGWIARRWPSQASDIGKRLDPMADAVAFHVPLWGLAYATQSTVDAIIYGGSSILLGFRDGYLFRCSIALEKEKEIFQVSKLGKIKTAINMMAITILITVPEGQQFLQHTTANNITPSSVGHALSDQIQHTLSSSGIESTADIREFGRYLLGIGTAASLASLVDYWQKIKDRVKGKSTTKDKI